MTAVDTVAPVSPRGVTAPHRTSHAIASLVAIPVVTVTAAAQLGDVASRTDRAAAIVGVVAFVAGVVGGLGAWRLARRAAQRTVSFAQRFAAHTSPLPWAPADPCHGRVPPCLLYTSDAADE